MKPLRPTSARTAAFAVGMVSLVLGGSGALGGCAAKDKLAPVGQTERGPLRKNAITPVSGHVIAQVGENTIGPYFARRGSGDFAAGLVAWVTPAEGVGRRVIVVPLTRRGESRGQERAIATVPLDTTSLVVRPMRGGSPGFVVMWTQLADRGESLWAAVLGDEGVPRSKAIELVRTTDDIVWVDAVPTDAGVVCMWAEETRSGEANVVAAALDPGGSVVGVPTRVARGVAGWHALEIPGGVAVSTIAAADESAKRKGKGGALELRKLDAEGRASGAPIAVTARPTVSGDVEVVRAGSRLVYAWTDRTGDEPTVVAAALDERGTPVPPRMIAEIPGGAALLGLASGPAGTAIMFEAPTRARAERRRVHLAHIGDNLGIEGRPFTFEVIGRSVPELAATATGFSVLATTRNCEPGSLECENTSAVPTIMRTDAALATKQREPLTFGTDPAGFAWGLSCDGDACFSIAASGGAPSRIRIAEVNPRTNAAPAAPSPAPVPVDGPSIVDVTAIAPGENVVDLSAAKLGDNVLVATLGAKAAGGAGAGASAGAGVKRHGDESMVLTTRIIDPNGAASPAAVLSTRALSIGGVAVAGTDKPDDGGAVVWVARDNGDPEVHVTRIDKRGKRTNDIQLTTTKGDATDVAIAWAGGGWIVAWVDARDGNGEVYATKVSPELTRIAREERITTAPGDASDLVALARGDVVWLAWADPRESPKDGMADVFLASVRTRDGKRASEDIRIMASAAHSRTPQLAAAGDGGVHVAWIEEAPAGLETPSSSGFGAMWATLDAHGKVSSAPAKVPLGGGGAAGAIAIEATTGGLRGIVARAGESIALDALSLGTSPRATPLLTLDAPPSLDVAMVLHEGILYFNDDGPAANDKRARRARIAWTP